MTYSSITLLLRTLCKYLQNFICSLDAGMVTFLYLSLNGCVYIDSYVYMLYIYMHSANMCIYIYVMFLL